MSQDIARQTGRPRARAATIAELSETVIPAFISPVPTAQTLRDWFDAARIPKFKSNISAKRGGGQCYYSTAHVEKFFQSRLVPA
jgi:hypothetical protein